MKLRSMLAVLFLVGCALVIGAVFVADYVDVASEEYKKERLRDPERFCIDNHVYLVAATSMGMAMAPALDDDGKPVRCEQ